MKLKQNLVINFGTALHGEITAPSSKSESVRALFFALLAAGQSTLKHVLHSDDTADALRVCQQLGATVSVSDQDTCMRSQGLPLHSDTLAIDSGNSGITTRFLLPIVGLREPALSPMILNCGEQMRARPIHSLVKALQHLGMNIQYMEQHGCYPIAVTGRLQGGHAEVEGITSQYLSALLISLPCAKQDSEIKVKNLHERPYVEMTLAWLDKQQIEYQHHRTGDVDCFSIKGGQRYTPFNEIIPGDFSSASYFSAAAALSPAGQLRIHGLTMNSAQGDKRLIPLLQDMGADIRIHPSHITITGGHPLRGLRIDANDIPDLVPTLAVIATQATSKTEIFNVKQARIKETDRLHSMTVGLRRLGAHIEEHEDGLTVYPGQLTGNTLHGFSDHRTIMALSLAGLHATGQTIIDDAHAIAKTFPNFVPLMQNIGADMRLIEVAQ